MVSGVYNCITCLDWIGDNRPKLLKDYEYTHLESYKKKQKAENFSAEPAETSCVVCEGEIDTEDDIGRYTQCEDCFKPYHNDEDCGFETGPVDTYYGLQMEGGVQVDPRGIISE